MALNFKSLTLNTAGTSTSATSRQLLYTANNGVATIEQFTVNNNSGGSLTVFFYIKSDATLSGTVQEIHSESISAGATAIISELIGHKIPSSGTLQAHCSASASDIYFTVSGTERT